MAARKPAPRMTKAHFVFLADLIKTARQFTTEPDALREFDRLVSYPTANALGETNPDFDLMRFLKAVGIDA